MLLHHPWNINWHIYSLQVFCSPCTVSQTRHPPLWYHRMRFWHCKVLQIHWAYLGSNATISIPKLCDCDGQLPCTQTPRHPPSNWVLVSATSFSKFCKIDLLQGHVLWIPTTVLSWLQPDRATFLRHEILTSMKWILCSFCNEWAICSGDSCNSYWSCVWH